MKRLAFVVAVLAITACSKSENAADTSKPTMAAPPAPAATPDTGMKMGADTSKKMNMDTTKKDTTKKKP